MTGPGAALAEMSDGTAIAAGFSLTPPPPGFIDDPFPVYRALRENAPVKRIGDNAWFLTRHADLARVYKDTTLFSSDKKAEFAPKFGDGYLFRHHTTSLVFNDPPLHTRVRRILAGALTPRAVQALEPDVIALVDRLLDEMEKTGGTVDLIEDFAAAIPVEVIGNLLDVPHDERGPLRDWSLAILGALEPALTQEQFQAGEDAVRDFLAYLETLVARRRANPGDPDRDMLTRLLAGEPDGGRLSEEELLQNCVFILNAGHETTTNLIGNALELLDRFPDERARLLADPGLVPSAVEEALRFESSNQLGNRRTAVPVEIGGVQLPEGSSLTLCIGAANRDPAVFDDPERFDIGRKPNRHFAFASGPHQCIGMAVARLEGRIAIERFLSRFPRYRLEGTPVRSQRIRFRGFTSIPARLEGQTMTKQFASAGDMTEKEISFSEIGRNLWAFTAEGDPNSGVIIGDESVMVIEAQATPQLARKVIERVRSVTDKPISHLVLTHYHAVRVLGASAYEAPQVIMSDTARAMVAERGAEDWSSEFERFPRLFDGHGEIPGLTWPTTTFSDRMTVYLGNRRVDLMKLGRAHTAGDIVVHVPDENVMFTGDIVEYHSACYCGDGHFKDWPQTLEKIRAFDLAAIAPGRGDALVGADMVNAALTNTADFVRSTYDPVARVAARGGSLKEAWDACRAACDPKFADYAIYEHCLPFNVARAFDEAQGIDTPRIWTAARDKDMWNALQG